MAQNGYMYNQEDIEKLILTSASEISGVNKEHLTLTWVNGSVMIFHKNKTASLKPLQSNV